MSREKKQRISTEVGPVAAWQPFAGLEISGLPQTASESPKSPEKSKRERLKLRRSTAHRGGKVVTIVDASAASLSAEAIDDLAGLLRKRLSTGGTVRERAIEVQGDRVGEVRGLLEESGFRVDGER